MKPHSNRYELLPGLPNSVASHILARIPFTSFPAMRMVASPWRRFFSSPELWNIRKSLAHLETLLITCLWTDDGEDARLVFHVWDQQTSTRSRLPPLTLTSSHSFPYVIGLRLEVVSCKFLRSPHSDCSPAAFSQTCPVTRDSPAPEPCDPSESDDSEHYRPCLVLFGVERFSPVLPSTDAHSHPFPQQPVSSTLPSERRPWQLSSSCWCLDLTAGTWLPLPPLLRPRAHSFSCVTSDRQRIVTVGGIDDLSAIFRRDDRHVADGVQPSSSDSGATSYEFLGEWLDLRTGLVEAHESDTESCTCCESEDEHTSQCSGPTPLTSQPHTVHPRSKRVQALSQLRRLHAGRHLAEGAEPLDAPLLARYRRRRARPSPDRGARLRRTDASRGNCYANMHPHPLLRQQRGERGEGSHMPDRTQGKVLTWQPLTSASWPRHDPWLHVSGCAAFYQQLFVFRSARTAKHWQADRVDVCLLPSGQPLGSAQFQTSKGLLQHTSSNELVSNKPELPQEWR